MYSSAADITKLGRGILSSQLIPKSMTRRWIKPVTFTSDPAAGLATPWGIRKIQLLGQPYRWTYGYQKAGRIGDYASLQILLPDYDIGFTVLMAGDIPGNFNFDCADYIGTTLLPAFENAAKREAGELFNGQYFASTGSVNSSMSIVTDDQPGLGVASWYSNGTDMNYISVLLQLSTSGPVTPRVRLYPTLLETIKADGSKVVSYKAVFEDKNSPSREGRMFSTDCATWLTVTSQVYGSRPLDEFVFNIDKQGRVTSVEPIALRLPLSKVTVAS
jgi:hypothetical protein